MIDLTAQIDDKKIINGFDKIEKSAKSSTSSIIKSFDGVDNYINRLINHIASNGEIKLQLDASESVQRIKELREVAKDAVNNMQGDVDALDAFFKKLNQEIDQSKKFIAATNKEIRDNQKTIDALRSKLSEANQQLKAATSGTIGKNFETEKVKVLKQEIAGLTSQLNELNRENKEAKEYISQTNQDIDKYAKIIKLSKDELKAYQSSHTSLRTQMANVRNEMSQLELSGQRNSARYKELQNELGRLGTAYRKVQQEQKNLTTGATQWAGIQSGLQGLMGAYAAGIGVIGLFTSKNEKLIEIQTKLQSIMGVIIGLSQVSNALHATSEFRITTLTKVTKLWNAANAAVSKGLIALGVSAKAANVASKALTTTISFGIGAAIAIVTTLISKLISIQQKAKQAADDAAKAKRDEFENYARSVASNASGTIAKFKELQLQYNKLGDSLKAKEKFINENQQVFKNLGVSIESVNEAENLFINNADAFRLSVETRAKAAAAMKIATDKYEEVLKVQAKLDEYGNSPIAKRKEKLDWLGDVKYVWEVEGFTEEQNEKLTSYLTTVRKRAEKTFVGGPYSALLEHLDRAEREAEVNYVKRIVGDKRREKEALEAEFNRFIEQSIEEQKKADQIFRNANIKTDSTDSTDSTDTKASKDQLWEIHEQKIALERDLEQSEINLMKEGADKKIAQINLDTKRQLDALNKRERELNQLYKDDTSSDRYKAGVSMKNEFNGNVDLLARKLVDASKLVEKGWQSAGDGIATVFSSQYGIADASGKVHEILITPILPDGTVLSEGELEDYINNQLEGVDDILKADKDKFGIVIAIDVDESGDAGSRLHELQETFYEPFINLEQQRVNAKESAKNQIVQIMAEEDQAMNDYLIRYGSMAERREAIEKSYAEKIANAKTEGERKMLETELNNLTVEADRESWNKYLLEFGTFRERLQATKEHYDRLLEKSNTEGDRAMIQQEYDAVLAEFEVQASEWAQELSDKTVSQLEQLMADAENRLEEARKAYDGLDSMNSDEGKNYLRTINTLKAQIKELKKQLDGAKKSGTSNDWKKSASLFNQISSTAQEAASALGEFDEGLGKAMTAVVQLSSVAGTLAEGIQSIKKASEAASEGMQMLEKSSGILAIITAAFQLMQGIFSLFGGPDPVEETREDFRDLNREIIRLKRSAQIDDWKGTIFDKDGYRAATENLSVYTKAFARYNETIERIKNRGKESDNYWYQYLYGGAESTSKANLWKIKYSWESAAQSIANMAVQTRHSTLFRRAKYDTLSNLLPDLIDKTTGELNMEALKKFSEEDDLFDKLTKENKELIEDLIADWELYNDALDSTKNYLEDIFGDLGSTITDSLVDAFANGTDAAEAYCESVEDMIKQLASDMIYSLQLAPLFEKAQDELLAAMENKDKLSPEEQFGKYAQIIRGLMNDVQEKQNDVDQMLKAFKEAGDLYGLNIFKPEDDGLSAQEATRRGFDTMSQDTGDELLGRMTAIQGDVHDIRAFIESSAAQNTEQLNQIVNVRDVMIQINGNVADIRAYTRVLPTMSETLISMNSKLDDL